jgi:hypothetical protein
MSRIFSYDQGHTRTAFSGGLAMKLNSWAAPILITCLAAAGTVPLSAQRAAAPRIPRTPDGRPDLQGVWDFRTLTPLERPRELGDKTVLTAEEAAAFEREQIARQDKDNRSAQARQDVEGAYNNFWWDYGNKVVGTRRTSLIVDPPDGRMPPMTPEAQKRATGPRLPPITERVVLGAIVDGPEHLGLSERCILGFSSGPPILSNAYNNNLQIVQTRDYVVIHTEMIHEARVVPLDGRPHVPQGMRLWLGDSRGRWEGDTFVIETTNFTAKSSFSGSIIARGGSTAGMHLIEKFTRVAEDTLLYEFTVTDPATWTKPWTVQLPMARSSERIFEYACHEGNYSMPNMLKGARAAEQK